MFKNLCRICTRTTAESNKPLKLFTKRTSKLLLQIESVTGLMLTKQKSMPEYMCACCQLELEQAVAFRERCIDAQEVLQQAVLDAENSRSSPNVKSEEVYKIEIQTDVKEEYVDTDEDNVQMMLQYEPSLDAEGSNDAVEEDEGIKHIDVDYVDKEVDDEVDEEIDELDAVLASDNEFVNDEEIEPEQAIENIQKVTKKGRRKKGQGVNNKTFFCDQCGNHIMGRHAFNLHLRRHFGVKEYQCEICTDRFCTHSELKRHMRRHTGERPFGCKYCDRKFTDYSTRVKHERTHTNERPFSCGQCGKAFTSTYILKNHMLTHTGERSFKCESCNKSFQRQSHLSTHYRSLAHKQNVDRMEKRELEEDLKTENAY